MDQILTTGREACEEMGDLPLPYRHIIVLTTQPSLRAKENTGIMHLIDELLSYSQAVSGDIYVSSSSRIFQELLPYIGRVWRTSVGSMLESDTHIGNIDFSDFALIREYEGMTNQENLYAHRFQRWEGVRNRVVSRKE